MSDAPGARPHGHHTAPRDHDGDHDDEQEHGEHGGNGGHERRMYLRFAAMIATSTLVMFVLTYTNAYQVEHIRYSQERVYMALLMGGAMALVMLSFMVSMMYKNRALNAVVVVVALLVSGTAYYASRSQLLVGDELYMRAMIPHHSIAILTSERADIDDVRVRDLADEIIRAQRTEIDEMEWLLEDIEANGPATTEEEAAERPVPDFEASAGGPADGREVRWGAAALGSLLRVPDPPSPER